MGRLRNSRDLGDGKLGKKITKGRPHPTKPIG
jgi:hypothetical protein